jgi:hypothetical protein
MEFKNETKGWMSKKKQIVKKIFKSRNGLRRAQKIGRQ